MWTVVQMSNLIRSRKAVSAAQSSPPPSQPSAATAPKRDGPLGSWSKVAYLIYLTCISYFFAAKKNTRGPCRQLKTTKVTRVTNSRINIEYDERHRAASTAELHSSLAHDIGHVVRTHCPMQWKSWKVIPDEVKMEVRGYLSTNYKLEDLDDESLTYVNRLFGERYKQWKSDLHHHFQAFDDPQVALEEGCPKELEGREDSWAWLCAHFLAPEFPLGSSRVRLPTSSRYSARVRASSTGCGVSNLNETLDQTLGRRPGTYCRGMGNARRRE
ncbi:unnamed protein product, partial [Prunus brigantina]